MASEKTSIYAVDSDLVFPSRNKQYSSWSVHIKHDHKSFEENEALHLDPTANDIDLEPPAGEAFSYCIDRRWYRRLRSIFLISGYSRIHGPVFKNHFGVYGVYQERTRHLASSPWILHPYSVFRWVWDIMITILLVFILIFQPLSITFHVENLDDPPIVVLNLIIGLMFTIDIILNFRTGFVSNANDNINLEPRDICCKYVKTWFIIDFLSTIPYDSVHFVLVEHAGITNVATHDEVLKVLRLLELLKIFRLVRMIRYITKFQEAYLINPLYIRVINLFIVMFFTIHWITCLHYLVAEIFNPPSNRSPDSWVSQMNLWNATTQQRYMMSMVRAIANMAGVGYGGGDIVRTEDILCSMFSILLGCTYFALFIGNLSGIFVNVGVAQKKYEEIIFQVNEYMRFKQIPKDLQRRVILYYEHRYRRNFFNEDTILMSLSDVLRTQIQMFNCRRLIERVPLFRGLSFAVVQNLISRLQFEVFLPHDVIIGANSIGNSMYFIEHGTVTVLAPNGHTLARLREGEFFGEMSLLKGQKREATVVAVTYCDVFVLDREDFEEAVMGYPEIYEKLLKMAEERHEENKKKQEEAQDEREVRHRWKESNQKQPRKRERFVLPMFESSSDLLAEQKESMYTNV